MHRSLIILSIYECAGLTFGSSLFRWRSWSEQGPHSIPQPSPSNPMHTVVVVGLRRLRPSYRNLNLGLNPRLNSFCEVFSLLSFSFYSPTPSPVPLLWQYSPLAHALSLASESQARTFSILTGKPIPTQAHSLNACPIYKDWSVKTIYLPASLTIMQYQYRGRYRSYISIFKTALCRHDHLHEVCMLAMSM